MCARNYYDKTCNCDKLNPMHLAHDDARLDVNLGDRGDSLRKRFITYYAENRICEYGCYNYSKCKRASDCKKAHSTDPPLQDEDTKREFRRVHLEWRNHIEICSNPKRHDKLMCVFYHVIEDAAIESAKTIEATTVAIRDFVNEGQKMVDHIKAIGGKPSIEMLKKRCPTNQK